ncbi:MAG TPA: hypothetical protein VFB44_15495 [Thermoleophilaceae bacterium]|nr:hypothetical protein [Thermoleophilaceae bacterium]
MAIARQAGQLEQVERVAAARFVHVGELGCRLPADERVRMSPGQRAEIDPPVRLAQPTLDRGHQRAVDLSPAVARRHHYRALRPAPEQVREQLE